MRILSRTNYALKDSAQKNNTTQNYSRPNFASTFRISTRDDVGFLWKFLTTNLGMLKPVSIKEVKAEGEFSNHLLVSFSKGKDAEVLRVLKNSLAHEKGVRCNGTDAHSLSLEELENLNFDNLPVYNFFIPSRINPARKLRSSQGGRAEHTVAL